MGGKFIYIVLIGLFMASVISNPSHAEQKAEMSVSVEIVRIDEVFSDESYEKAKEDGLTDLITIEVDGVEQEIEILVME